jgi:hypothetical protein
MAFVKTFWDLKTNITYTTHTIGSFDNNTTTGGGDFEWIPNVNNSTIVDIAGMQIKPASSPTGYWKRVWNGPLNVGWFGCQNGTSTPYTFLQLGVSQSVLNTRYGSGFASVNDNYDTTAIRYAFSIMGSDGFTNSILFEPKIYHLTRACELPSGYITYSPTNIGTFVIDGNGCTIIKASVNQFDYFYRVPVDQTQAAIMVNYGFTIKNFNANGSGGVWQNSGYSFLYLGATTNSIIENINVQQFDMALRLEYCVNTIVQTINTSQITTYSLYAKSGGWAGAGLTNSNSNIAEISHVYVNDTLNQNAAIALIASDAGKISQTVIFGSGNPGYGIYIDSLTSTAVSTVRIQDTTLSAVTSSAGIYLKVNDLGRYIVDGIKNTVVQTVMGVEAYSGSPNVYMGNIGNWPVGSDMSNIGAADWEFDNVYFGPGIDSPADIVDPANNLWVTAGLPTIPSVTNIAYIPVGGQPQVSLQQVLDYNHDIVNDLIFMGTDAGLNNTGVNYVIGIGALATDTNSGTLVIGVGPAAARLNTGDEVVAIGVSAAESNTGDFVVGIGNSAAATNTGDYVTGIGEDAANANTGTFVVGIGWNAAKLNSTNYVLALGPAAGLSNALIVSTIISNQVLPTYANHAAALLVIVAPTATTGTYLYHNQATDSIGAVRIP